MKTELKRNTPIDTGRNLWDVPKCSWYRVVRADYLFTEQRVGDVVFVGTDAAYNMTREHRVSLTFSYVTVAPLTSGDTITLTV